jgi:hypothetical protein
MGVARSARCTDCLLMDRSVVRCDISGDRAVGDAELGDVATWRHCQERFVAVKWLDDGRFGGVSVRGQAPPGPTGSRELPEGRAYPQMKGG